MEKQQQLKIDIFDSTLRDGAQSEGINFGVEDKLAVVSALDALGVAYIEAGNPGSNPKDMEFFERAKDLTLTRAKLVAFGSTRRKDIRAEDDKNLQSLLLAGTKTVAVFGKCWDLHVTAIINTTLEENLNMIRDTMRFFASRGIEVIFDAEHFFDGYRANPVYALSAIKAAVEGGATTVALCDTNGGSFPSYVFDAVKAAAAAVPVKIGIHCHNDSGMAVACSIAAVEAGCKHVQGTFIGYGERCGNTNLSTIIANLQLKKDCSCIPETNIAELTPTAKKIAEISNIKLEQFMPYVGASAFTHKAGMHADGVLKLSKSFEHVDPSGVGNARRFVVSEMAGRTAILNKINRFFPEISKDSPALVKISERMKELEHLGYQFESAESSLILEVCKILGLYKPYFELISYDTTTTQPAIIEGCSAKALVKIRVQDKAQLTCAEGDGPVNALDIALRKCLEVFYPSLCKMSLVDYKVRVLDSRDTTASKVRVLISSTQGGDVWTTVGVSTDLIEASFKALTDSIEYKLMTDSGIIKTSKVQ